MADQLKKKKTRVGHRAYMTKIQPQVLTCIESFDKDMKPSHSVKNIAGGAVSHAHGAG